jgi:hypothetical protein
MDIYEEIITIAVFLAIAAYSVFKFSSPERGMIPGVASVIIFIVLVGTMVGLKRHLGSHPTSVYAGGHAYVLSTLGPTCCIAWHSWFSVTPNSCVRYSTS